MGTQFESVIEAPRGRHSEKPEIFAEMIEKMFPHLPKIELYRRGPARPGWSAWGAEAEDTEQEGTHNVAAARA
jgi:N6-adenosine-specific RNA methylase IME4